MKNGSVDELDRPNGRFARNLALSLGGGALITLLGASAAHADDAATQSEGAGAAHSGDATAVGNRSGTDAKQTGTVSGGLGSIQVTNQSALVPNTGIAVANTGGNVAVGNSSTNGNTVNQTGDSNLGPAVNQGHAANSSNGSASIWTGDASAVGNQSQTSLDQSSNAQGTLGGILIVGQNQLVSNSGVALANSGLNTATGNDSTNTGTLTQIANAAAGLATNTGSQRNDSDGKATIATGNASAVGNQSDSKVTQSSNGAAGGASGGLEVIEQANFVANLGVAVANSGGNDATGNESTNNAGYAQLVSGTPSIVGVVSNQADVANTSDGEADVWTGAATAMGNTSSTDLSQSTDDSTGDDGGGAIVTQASSVLNAGLGIANSGLNTATGNTSTNVIGAAQGVDDGTTPLLGVATETLSGGNTSDGTASISTGPSWASGNESTSDVSQTSESTGGTLNLLPQVSGVQNLGAAVADSGDNDATGNATSNQIAASQSASVGTGVTVVAPLVISNQADVQSTSDGSASVATGAAKATGNHSSTELGQDLDPSGLILPTQVAEVANVGIGVAESGGNSATGSTTPGLPNLVSTSQTAQIGSGSTPPVTFLAGQAVLSNTLAATNDVDGSASITTGDASATGNHSSTEVDQAGDNSVDGLGLIVGTQAAIVGNVGIGAANSGGNVAVGNASSNLTAVGQAGTIGSSSGAGSTLAAGSIVVSNQLDAGSSSDGSATIATGDAAAWGNDSSTNVSQDESGTVEGLGVNLETQVAAVGNVGVGVANSGANAAVGNASSNAINSGASALVGATNGANPVTVLGTSILASDSASAHNSSDGSASITTGDAAAWGNSSSTDLSQETAGSVSGMGLTLDTQAGGVLNAGLGVANSGGNLAAGNVSSNIANNTQTAQIASFNTLPPTVAAAGAVAASNSADISNDSDGDAKVDTGAATAHGNQSHTTISQDPDSAVDGMGTVIDTQVAGVANVGVGVANSGLNAAVGNASGTVAGQNSATAAQTAQIASAATGAPVTIAALGTVAATNSLSLGNSSDGSALVGTGDASADGNTSSTTIDQSLGGTATGGGVVLGTQAGGVANLGLGVANSGANAAVGNASTNTVSTTGTASISSATATPASFAALGPVVASNQQHADNASDGEACVCTGNATASGNVSQTLLDQDLDQSTGGGLVLLTESGGVLNAGLGIANSGLNLAVGNVSTNTATAQQTSTINDALLTTPITTSQVASNGGGASNSSAGAGKVGTGNAKGTGNESTTNLAQAADVDSTLSVSAVNGGTSNVGLGLANAGVNLGVGNASTNVATLIQAADGSGIVSNQGEATNDSDGTATIGNPDCDTPGETPPGETGLPRTGGPIAYEMAAALTLLLLGFGTRRTAQRLS